MTDCISVTDQTRWLALCDFCVLAECCRPISNEISDNFMSVRGDWPNCLVWRGRKANLEPEIVPDKFAVTPGGLVYLNGKGKR